MKYFIILLSLNFIVSCTTIERNKPIQCMGAGSPNIKAGGNKHTKKCIRETILGYKPEFKYCYDKVLKEKKSLNGKIVIRWTILMDGSVELPHIVSSDVNSDLMELCLLDKFKSFIFPNLKIPEDHDAVVTFPFVFTSNKSN